MPTNSQGMYFDVFEMDQIIETRRRTITGIDIANFACVSGGFNGVHTASEYCRTTSLSAPIGYAPLIYAVLGIDEFRMKTAVKHGDTVHIRSEVLGKRITSNPGCGDVKFKRNFINQRNEVVQSMLATSPYGASTGESM
jgi:acyl dehydratase